MSTEVKQHPKPEYIEGYIPQSLDAPHSSLQTASLWVGMFLVLVGIAASGIGIFGFASGRLGSQENGMSYLIVGAALAVTLWVIGYVLVVFGRRGVKKYRKENPMAEMH
ncbi:hypothetical protein [Corynebacterium ulceribovis]|uniref:hypothetical protein n=1 Tax=Corynebacterium ulceribovis TaxID=487732 RepID=UPI000365BDB5|nr:hypothetical protein [Corynebacterium ulceribovis]